MPGITAVPKRRPKMARARDICSPSVSYTPNLIVSMEAMIISR